VIPWTRSERANEAILAGYLALVRGRAVLLSQGAAWSGAAPPAPFSKGGGRKAGGCAPRFLVKIRAGAKRGAWRLRVAAGRVALVAAEVLGAVVSDGRG